MRKSRGEMSFKDVEGQGRDDNLMKKKKKKRI
jgi:hypothetical protein